MAHAYSDIVVQLQGNLSGENEIVQAHKTELPDNKVELHTKKSQGEQQKSCAVFRLKKIAKRSRPRRGMQPLANIPFTTNT